MYAGQIVETGTVRELISNPQHPYTRGLLAANLHGAKKGEGLEAIPGAPRALNEPPSSCSFVPRCKHAGDACRTSLPPAVMLGEGRIVRCVRVEPALQPASSRR
ncbi:oligopeptide/dipeptide ABC transporter ATP-binding protein [Bosea sp. LjRoot237]|uniref:oligopeptide/dipeptide ABC transporter ATP-binding protein n=1 Tax=Bosea sp. LjRoot237 TaxID=3342292 RepID=UPI003F50B49B